MSTSSAESQPNKPTRRHDLDALRALAMLLGIALHGAMAYMPGLGEAWPVTDASAHEGYSVFLSAIHGFRMPLFFLLSGFFTAMLWRRRGLGALLQHRAKRILLPLVIGTFTIVPAVWIALITSAYISQSSTTTKQDPYVQLWSAAAANEVESLERVLQGNPGIDLNRRDPTSGFTPLVVAACHNAETVATVLLGKGAELDARTNDQSTAAHLAFFFGQDEVAKVLVEGGTDLSLRNQFGATPADNLNADITLTRGVADMIQVENTNEEIIAGREQILSMLENSDLATKDSQETGSTLNLDLLFGILLVLSLFPVFHHLWFLYFLCWLVLGFAIYASIMDKLGWKSPPKWMVLSPVRYAWLFLLTLPFQYWMGLIYPSFGPDTSTGILPLPHLLAYYAVFFFFGVWYYDADDQDGRVGKYWWISIPVALLVICPLGHELALSVAIHESLSVQSLIPEWQQRPAALVLQILYVWMMSFGMMGLARRVFASENSWLRYLSDSSYWLYVAHLPLVMFVQGCLAPVPQPSFVKFALVLAISSALLLLSYEYCVRYTPIGTLLNGKKTRPSKQVDLAAASK
ncbi:MAG: acyltransferase family protein [Planctomycetota bacterium]